MFTRSLFAGALGLACLALGSCTIDRTLSEPTLRIRTDGGEELGVSTDYGIVFLGRTARAGDIEVTTWFGDGPNIEASVIEPIGGGIYTADMEIRLPSVPISFDEPSPGDTLLLAGHDGGGLWEIQVRVKRDPRVEGILLSVPSRLRGKKDQIGAGLYLCPEGDCDDRRLVGLVSGRIRLINAGGEKEYLTVMGPRDLWRLVTHSRDGVERRSWNYREDVR